MTTMKGELLEAKLRHGRALSVGRHISERLHRGLLPAPGAEARAAKAERGEVPSLKTKLTDEIQDRLAECLKLGMHSSAAAAGLGIARDTLARWLSQGKRDTLLELKTPYARLYVVLSAAQAEAEEKALRNLQEAAEEPKHWAANAWFLERRYPDRWGKKQTTAITGADGGPVKHQVAVLMVSPEKLNEALALTEGKNHQIIDVANRLDDDFDDPDTTLASEN